MTIQTCQLVTIVVVCLKCHHDTLAIYISRILRNSMQIRTENMLEMVSYMIWSVLENSLDEIMRLNSQIPASSVLQFNR